MAGRDTARLGLVRVLRYMAFDNNHAPLEVPEAEFVTPFYDERGNAADWLIYQGMITAVDWAVGNIVAAIKKRPGMWENSVAVWTSDNGGQCAATAGLCAASCV